LHAKPATPADPKPRKRRRWLRWSVEAALFVGVWFGLQAWMRRNLLPADGRPAPAVTLRHLDGRPATLADYRGEAVQLHFWATWCGVCRMEHGALNAVHEGLAPGQRLISVVADGDDLDHLRKYLAEHDVRYPVLIADQAALAAFGVSSFPTNFYLSPEGNLSAHDIGWSTRWGMRARLSGCW
jgi:thiol-disulfide isomerase/thioredoxin